MRVIIGSGKVSSIIRKKDDVVLTHSDIEVTDRDAVERVLGKFPSGTPVINTAAKINLEWCEENKGPSAKVNLHGALNVAHSCWGFGHHLIHISSGCIFDGMETEKIYSEEDNPTPSAWYTSTKAEADKSIIYLRQAGYEKVTIVRPRQLISAVPHPTNMITKFLTLRGGKFITSKNSLTCIEDMGDMIDHLIHGSHYGIYNLANEGHVSPYEIALKIKEKLQPDFEASQIEYNDYVKTLKVKRVNTLLDITKLKSTGYAPRSAEEALTWCLDNYGKTSS